MTKEPLTKEPLTKERQLQESDAMTVPGTAPRASVLRSIAAIALVSLCAGAFTLSAWGEGVDIFPFRGGGDGGGISNGGGGPGDTADLVAVYRMDGGDVWSERGRREHPGVTFEGIQTEGLYEGTAADAGTLAVDFEVGLIDPEFKSIELPEGLKGSGQMMVTDLRPDDKQRALLEAGRAGHGVLLLYVGTARPLGHDPLGGVAGMTHVDTIPLEHPCVDLNQIRRDAQASLGGSDLDVGMILFDRYLQYAVALFNVDSTEATYIVHAKDVGRR